MDSYVAQRLAALGNDDIEALKAENARLKQQLEQTAPTFKSAAQAAFEQSPEFEQLLNAFYLRFMRDKFGAEFRSSQYANAFQEAANRSFTEFEKNYKKEAAKSGQAGKKDIKASGTDAGKDA